MDGLRALLINDNRLTGDVPESLTLLTNIEILRLGELCGYQRWYWISCMIQAGV